MTIEYGLPNTERTEITEWRELLPTDTKRSQQWFIMPDGSKVGSPQEEHFLAAGWVLKVVPEYDSATHKLLTSYIVGVDTTIQDVIELTLEELSDIATSKFNSDMTILDLKVTARVTEDIYDYAMGITSSMPQFVVDIMNERKSRRAQG